MGASPVLPPEPPAPVMTTVVSSAEDVGLPYPAEVVSPTTSITPPAAALAAASTESSPKPSWVSVISETEADAPLPRVSISRSKGVVSTSFPAEILKDQTPLWTKFIAGHFIGEVSPHIGKVHATVNRLWATQDKRSRIDAQFISPKVVLFKIDDDKMRSRVLQRHFWHVADIPMIVQEWSPSTATASPDLSSIPLWVDFIKVPDSLFSKKGLLFLGNLVGKAQKLHASTERCMRFDVARVLVEVNLNNELPAMVCLKGETDISISIAYPWLPPKCVKCGRWGHKAHACDQEKEVETVVNLPTEVISQETPPKPVAEEGIQNTAETEIPEQSTNTQIETNKASNTSSPVRLQNSTGNPQPLEAVQNDHIAPPNQTDQSINVDHMPKVSTLKQVETHSEKPAPQDEADHNWTVVSKAKGSPSRTIMTRGKCVATGDLVLSRYQALQAVENELQNLDDIEDGEINSAQQDTSASEAEGLETQESYPSDQETANTQKAAPKKQTISRQGKIKVSRQAIKSKKSSSRKA